MRRACLRAIAIPLVLLPLGWPAATTAQLPAAKMIGDSSSVAADDFRPIVGTWKLTSYTRLELDTNTIEHSYGEHPTGYVRYTSSGTIVLAIARDDRKPAERVPSADEDAIAAERAQFFHDEYGVPPSSARTLPNRTYVGTYNIDGNKIIYHIDSAWVPAWNGSNQVRYFTIEGKKLTIKSEPRKSLVDGKNVISIAIFEKSE